MFHILRFHMVTAVAAGGLVQFLPQALHDAGHFFCPVLIHHLAEVVFQRILGEIRQGLVHGVVFLWRGSDSDTAGGSVILVQVVEIHTAADTALQQNGGQIGNQVNGKVEIHLHAV